MLVVRNHIAAPLSMTPVHATKVRNQVVTLSGIPGYDLDKSKEVIRNVVEGFLIGGKNNQHHEQSETASNDDFAAEQYRYKFN